MSDTTKLIIDGDELEVPSWYNLLQACEEAGAEIPRFCYHERLSVAGNCRMCLVEVKGGPPKPVASCAQGVRDLRPGPNGEPPEVSTKSDMVKKARNGVMEFLLINHPLDCPICDQGGECDLQDQAMAYGRGGSRFDENKRAVDDKNMGPLVNTIMTRCIQCTRCVRFIAEVGGVEEIGMASRGEGAEITTYLEANLTSNLSGNVIDLCPVGALTSKPYAFNARPWELTKTETIDVMDAMGANIRMDVRGAAVMRIQPTLNDDVNEEWISDKSRFCWDGLNRQRLDKPYIRENGKLREADWGEALSLTAEKLSGDPQKIAALAGDLACVEGMKATLDLMRDLGVQNTDCRQDGSQIGVDGEGKPAPRQSYLFNSTFAGIDEADAILLIGTNPRDEMPVMNARIRHAWLERDVPIALIGAEADLTYDYDHISDDPSALNELLAGKGFGKALKSAEKPMIIVGQGAQLREDGADILRAAQALAHNSGTITEAWNGFNILHTAAARVGGLDIGFLPGEGGMDIADVIGACETGSIETVLLLGADEIEGEHLGNAFVIYIGSHGDRGAHRADVILPAAAYSEKTATYVNTEGRVQMTSRALFPKGEAKEDWAILRAISEVMGKALPYDTADQLREQLAEENSIFQVLGVAPGAEGADAFAASINAEVKPTLSSDPIEFTIDDFYLTNAIARASKTLAEVSADAKARASAASTPIAAE